MSESMREAIARAIGDKLFSSYAVEFTAEEEMDLADVVLDALTEPTEAMFAACWPLHHPWGQNAPPPNERQAFYDEVRLKVRADWQAMIAAAKDTP